MDCNNAAGIGDNSAEIGDNDTGIGNIDAKVIPVSQCFKCFMMFY